MSPLQYNMSGWIGKYLDPDSEDEHFNKLMKEWTDMDPDEMAKAEKKAFDKLQRSLIFPRPNSLEADIFPPSAQRAYEAFVHNKEGSVKKVDGYPKYCYDPNVISSSSDEGLEVKELDLVKALQNSLTRQDHIDKFKELYEDPTFVRKLYRRLSSHA